MTTETQTEAKRTRWQVRGGYKPRARKPNEALPNTINMMALPPYKPEPVLSVRPGADDFRAVQSRGYRT